MVSTIFAVLLMCAGIVLSFVIGTVILFSFGVFCWISKIYFSFVVDEKLLS